MDPDSLRTSGQQLEAITARFSAELSSFRAQLSSFGEPWGHDDIGSLIGVAHEEVSSYAFECYQSALDEITFAGEDLGTMGDLYDAAESAITERLASLRNVLE
ncbi:hypothetical protein [Melissospora conviva]|uniref:hypothetical protein n=1 Tax=Melissospora conviva TaxID=3388432 RepID=UPI003B7FD630